MGGCIVSSFLCTCPQNRIVNLAIFENTLLQYCNYNYFGMFVFKCGIWSEWDWKTFLECYPWRLCVGSLDISCIKTLKRYQECKASALVIIQNSLPIVCYYLFFHLPAHPKTGNKENFQWGVFLINNGIPQDGWLSESACPSFCFNGCWSTGHLNCKKVHLDPEILPTS